MGKGKRLLKLGVSVVLLLSFVSLFGCAKKSADRLEYEYSSDSTAASEPAVMEMESEAKEESKMTDNATSPDFSNRKIILTKYISMETLEFDKTTTQIKLLVSQNNGYIENSQVNGVGINDRSEYNTRSAYFTFRIPEDNFLGFIDDMKTLGNVVNERDDSADVTTQYYDVEARINSLEVQEERLLAILEKAEKLEDILAIEQQLTEVRYQIESYAASMKNLQNQIQYGTIQMDLIEVYEISELEEPALTTWEKISDGFTNSLENIADFFKAFFIGFIVAIPYLILWGAIIFIIIVIIRKSLRKKAKKSIEKKNEVQQVGSNE